MLVCFVPTSFFALLMFGIPVWRFSVYVLFVSRRGRYPFISWLLLVSGSVTLRFFRNIMYLRSLALNLDLVGLLVLNGSAIYVICASY